MGMTSPAAQLDDVSLIQRVLAGDTESFSHLVDRHAGAVRRCVLRIVRNESDADDLVQDVFFKVWSRLSTFRRESSFRTWITRVAINETLMLWRREKDRRRLQPIENESELVSPRERTDKALIRMEVAREVRRTVEQLPSMYRSVVTLHDLDGLSVKETALRVKATVPAVKSRLFRGRLMLSESIPPAEARLLASAA